MQLDLEVVITAHAEGPLVHRTLLSVFQSIKHASRNGIACGVLVVKDIPTPATNAYFSRFSSEDLRILNTDFGDPGLARNYGIHNTNGAYVALLDADDLYSADWLTKAVTYLRENADREFMAIPKHTLVFGAEDRLVSHPDSDSMDFNAQEYINSNCWNSVISILRSDTARAVPFISTPPGSGFGYEDWHWFSALLAHGVTIKTVPQTIVFYRRKLAGSRLAYHATQNCLVPPSPFFFPPKFWSYISTQTKSNTVSQTKGFLGCRTSRPGH